MAKLMRKENAIMQVEDNKVKEYKSRGYEEVTEGQLKEDARKAVGKQSQSKTSSVKSGDKDDK